MQDSLALTYQPVDELPSASRNPKGHDLDRIRESIRVHGFVSPLVVDEETGRLVAGHGRRDAVLAMKEDGEDAPDRVRVDGDRWLVPIVRVPFSDPAAAEAYLVADNRLVEVGGWNDEELVAMLSDLADHGLVEGTGFTADDLDDLVSQLERVEETSPEPFLGGSNETPEEEAKRLEGYAAAGDRAGFREVVLLVPVDSFADFAEQVRELKKTWETGSTSDTIVEAVRRCAT